MSGLIPGALVALHGIPGAGKDTLADYLVEHYGFHKIAFADSLYEAVSQAFNVPIPFLRDRANKETPHNDLSIIKCEHAGYRQFLSEVLKEDLYEDRTSRYHLDRFGTDYMRYMGTPHHWVNLTMSALREHGEWNTVITDMRSYRDLREFYAFKQMAASLHAPSCVVQVYRPEAAEKAPKHEAHALLPGYAIDLTVTNTASTPEEFAKSATKQVVDWFLLVRSRVL